MNLKHISRAVSDKNCKCWRQEPLTNMQVLVQGPERADDDVEEHTNDFGFTVKLLDNAGSWRGKAARKSSAACFPKEPNMQCRKERWSRLHTVIRI